MTPMRAAALALLPEIRGIFLRCDRGNSLYVTNAPALTDAQIDWTAAGFCKGTEGRLIYLTPMPEWNERFNKWIRPKVREGRLADSVENASFGAIMDADMALFVEGVKRLEMRGDVCEYEKRVRQRAAVCLREKRGGGTLVSCALIVDYLNEGGKIDEA